MLPTFALTAAEQVQHMLKSIAYFCVQLIYSARLGLLALKGHDHMTHYFVYRISLIP